MNGYYHHSFYNSNNRRNSYVHYSHHHNHQQQQLQQQHQQNQGFGTLTPILKQRAFHDAIYEEEYGSDQEDECCQSRGMSAIFCWFLSVIILIGLAASVVLTVFFILKSKNYMSKNGELDLFDGEHGINFHFPETTTELNSLDFPSSASSSKESSIPSSMSFEDEDNNDEETENNSKYQKSSTTTTLATTSKTTTSTRFPPSRKGPSEMFSDEEKTSEVSDSPATFTGSGNTDDFPQSTSRESYKKNGKLSRPSTAGGSEEIVSNESSNKHSGTHKHETSSSRSAEDNHRATTFTTTTSPPPSQHVLFTSPPDNPVTPSTTYRRNLQTTRFPTGRTSFSTSVSTSTTTESTPDDEEHESNHENNEHEHEDNEHTNENDNDHEGDEDGDEDDDDDAQSINRERPDHSDNEHEQDDHNTLTTQHDTVTSPTTLVESKEHEVHVPLKSDESQLNTMLLDEIPPHPNPNVNSNYNANANDGNSETQNDQSESESSEQEEEVSSAPPLSSEFNLPAPTTQAPPKETTPVDHLARLIKNLAPKWGRNRTIETTTLSSGNFKYDFTISSREKDKTRSKELDENSSKDKYKSQETSTPSNSVSSETVTLTPQGNPSTSEIGFKLGDNRGSASQPINILNTIQSPNLSRRQDHDSNADNPSGDGQFLDILVGSEDHKTLITKQTEDGIVTSAILPPWYSTSGQGTGPSGNNNNTQINSNGGHRVEVNRSPEVSKTDVEESPQKSIFGGIFDLFKKLPAQNTNNDEEYNPKRIVLKRPGGELLAQGSSHVAQNSNNINGFDDNNPNQRQAPTFKDMIRSVAPGLRSTTIAPSSGETAIVTDDILPANNAFHYGTSDGGTNIYGYYPDEEREKDRTVEHHGVQSEDLSDEMMDQVQDPSHSIELQVGSQGSSEIVIEQDGPDGVVEDDPYSRYGEDHAGSENHGQVVPAPPSNGGGIRHPISEEEDEMDLEMKGSEIQPMFARTSTTVESPEQVLNSNLTSEPELKTGQAFSVEHSANISGEIVDNSAERDPPPAGSDDLSNLSTSFEEELSGPEEGGQVQQNAPIPYTRNDLQRRRPLPGLMRQQHQSIPSIQGPPQNQGSPQAPNQYQSHPQGLNVQQSQPQRPQIHPSQSQGQFNHQMQPQGPFNHQMQPQGQQIHQMQPQEPQIYPTHSQGSPAPTLHPQGPQIPQPRPQGQQITQPYPQAPQNPTPPIQQLQPQGPQQQQFQPQGEQHQFQSQESQQSQPTGSYETMELETSGSQEPKSGEHQINENKKWSAPDRFASGEIDPELPATGSEELKVNTESGDTNEVLERKPVLQLDEKLYPDSSDVSAASQQSQSIETKVQQVYPEGYVSSTTERPSDESTITEPEKAAEYDADKSSGFVPPTPVSFHDNKYTFSPASDSIYQSKDGWRPLVYNGNEDVSKNSFQKETHSTRPPFWQNKQTNTPSSGPPLSHPTTPIPQSAQILDEEEGEEEMEEEGDEIEEGEGEDEEHLENEQELNKFRWGEREQLMEKPASTYPPNVNPTQVTFPEQNQHHGSHESFQPHQMSHENFQKPPGSHENFPKQLYSPQQPPHHPQQQQTQIPQQQQQQPYLHPPPGPPPQGPHQQRQQFHYQNQNNPNIDRSKYMMRPAPPPIVMRRAPIQSMPYLPNRPQPPPPRPQLIPQVQQPNQFLDNNAHASEFQHPPPSLLNRRRFKNLGPRPRGNVNWPTDDSRKVDTAERRNG